MSIDGKEKDNGVLIPAAAAATQVSRGVGSVDLHFKVDNRLPDKPRTHVNLPISLPGSGQS